MITDLPMFADVLILAAILGGAAYGLVGLTKAVFRLVWSARWRNALKEPPRPRIMRRVWPILSIVYPVIIGFAWQGGVGALIGCIAGGFATMIVAAWKQNFTGWLSKLNVPRGPHEGEE